MFVMTHETLYDRAVSRGVKAKKERAREPKAYPLEKGEWSSCDETDIEEDPEMELAQASMGF